METPSYHVIVVNLKTGYEVQMTDSPLSHVEACVLLSKIARHKWRRKFLRQA